MWSDDRKGLCQTQCSLQVSGVLPGGYPPPPGAWDASQSVETLGGSLRRNFGCTRKDGLHRQGSLHWQPSPFCPWRNGSSMTLENSSLLLEQQGPAWAWVLVWLVCDRMCTVWLSGNSAPQTTPQGSSFPVLPHSRFLLLLLLLFFGHSPQNCRSACYSCRAPSALVGLPVHLDCGGQNIPRALIAVSETYPCVQVDISCSFCLSALQKFRGAMPGEPTEAFRPTPFLSNFVAGADHCLVHRFPLSHFSLLPGVFGGEGRKHGIWHLCWCAVVGLGEYSLSVSFLHSP